MWVKDSDNLFLSLKEEVSKYSTGFWGTNILFERTPFEFERNQLKKGKILSKPPKNKANKTFHLKDMNENIIAIYNYIENWNEPSDYIFIKRENDIMTFFNFNIEKILVSMQQNNYQNGNIIKSKLLENNHNFIEELYSYDNENRIIKINRKHKNIEKFGRGLNPLIRRYFDIVQS
jgi:hypothetical protein